MKLNYLLPAVICAAVLSACNLSKFPLDDPANVKIDSRLTGKWQSVQRSDKDVIELYTITKMDDYQYRVTAKEKHGKKKEHYVAFLSLVDTTRFLNVYCTDDTEKRYLFLRLLNFDAAGTRLTASSVDDTTLQYLTSVAQVREKVTRNLYNPGFYKDTVQFVKVK